MSSNRLLGGEERLRLYKTPFDNAHEHSILHA